MNELSAANSLQDEAFDSRAGLLAFHGLFIFQLLSNSRTLLMDWFGPGLNQVGAVAQAGSICLGLGAACLLGRSGAFLIPLARLWMAAVLLITIDLALYGWIFQPYSLHEVFRDASAYALAIGFVALGASAAFWRQALRWCFLYFLAAVAVNFLAMRDFSGLVGMAGAEARVARESLSYRVQNALDFWPLLLLLAPYARGRQVTALAAGITFVIGQQILFQKRLEIVFILGLLLLYYAMQPWRLGWPGRPAASTGLIRRVILCSMAGLFLAGLWMPSVLKSQAAALMLRFEGRAPRQQVAYSHGIWSVFTTENERLQIAMRCFEGFALGDWMIGRGMGGAFPYAAFDPKLLQTSHRAELINRFYLEDVDYFGRRNFETGFLMPWLKGGCLLAGVFYAIYLLPLARLPGHQGDRFTSGCLALAYYWLAYTVMGGNFSTGLTFQMLGMYAPLGWCLSKMEEN